MEVLSLTWMRKTLELTCRHSFFVIASLGRESQRQHSTGRSQFIGNVVAKGQEGRHSRWDSSSLKSNAEFECSAADLSFPVKIDRK
jgi:hypothetical protein